jgi:hypothetical protein
MEIDTPLAVVAVAVMAVLVVLAALLRVPVRVAVVLRATTRVRVVQLIQAPGAEEVPQVLAVIQTAVQVAQV